MTGGNARERAAVARAFHGASPLRGRPFVALDCGRDAPVLRRALQGWLLATSGAVEANPLGAVGGGTLFLDHLERLSDEVQQQLLVVARRMQVAERAAAEPLPARLAAGYAGWRGGRAHTGIVPELLDFLDKIRVEAGASRPRGPGRTRRGAAAARNGAAPAFTPLPEEVPMPDATSATSRKPYTTKWGVARRGRPLTPSLEQRELVRLVRMQVREEVEHVLPDFVRKQIVRLLTR